MRLTTRHPVRTYIVLASVYIALLLNAVIFVRRYAGLQAGEASAPFVLVFAEMGLVMFATASLLAAVSLLGQWVLKTVGSLVMVISAVASYYMTFFNVIIGYGLVQAVFTTDIDMTKEVVGAGMLVWVLMLGVLPAFLLWRHVRRTTNTSGAAQGRHGPRRLASLTTGNRVVLLALCAACTLAFYQLTNAKALKRQQANGQDIPAATLVAHSYVPFNWVASVAMSASNYWETLIGSQKKLNPALAYHYTPTMSLEDEYLVVVIGESARSMNMGVYGYPRDNTPYLSKEKNVVALKAQSCNTSTKLSLACMFIRPGGVIDHGLEAPEVKETGVFSVLKKLGFTIDLFAMQAEVWFYNSVNSDSYKIREVIAAQTENRNRSADDLLLIDEVKKSIDKHPKGRHVIILHTKGSHYLYTSRYPRSFAKYQPECVGIDGSCSKEELINSYDNTIAFTDHFLHQLMRSLDDKKVLLVYTSDHGESISEKSHFHATPKPLAPPEQTAVPLIFWASNPFLQDPANQRRFDQLRLNTAKPAAHENLFDSILGCLGIASTDGGSNPTYNLCH